MSLSEFLHMGGYGGYVWSCYALTAAVLIGNAWAARRQLAAQRRSAERRIRAAQVDADGAGQVPAGPAGRVAS